MLEGETEQEQAQALLNRLLLESNNSEEFNNVNNGESVKPYSTVVPTAGFCLKTKNEANEKFFINICMSESVPRPPEISEDELIKLLESDDPTQYRIPMSIGAPHAEIDKSGQGCTAYDVIVHPVFYEKMVTSELFKTFFITVMLEGVESKYDQLLSRDWVVLKNRKFIGDLSEQYVRDKSKSLITELQQSEMAQKNLKPNLIEEIKPAEKIKGSEPKFTIIQEPVSGHPEFMVAEIHLPLVKTSQTLELDIGEDRIVLDTRSSVYYLDIYLPYNIYQEECGAQFDRKTKILTLTMSVQP